MTKHRIIEPRLETAASDTSQHAVASRLPDTLLFDQVQRLAVCTAVGAGLWTYGLLMDTLVRPLTMGIVAPPGNIVIEIAAIAISVFMFLYVRYARHASPTKTDIGLAYFIVNAIAVSLLATLWRT